MDKKYQSLITNKHSLRNFIIIDTYTAGIQLTGAEVKTIRSGRGILTGSFASIHTGELWLRKMHIPAYQEKNTKKDYNPNRERKLLLRSSELSKISQAIAQRGITLVPIEIHNGQHHRLRITLGLTKNASKHDKRQKIKSRDTERELAREIKGKIRL